VGSDPSAVPAYSNLTRRIYGSDLSGLFEAGEAVRALVAHPGWVHVSRLVEEEIAQIDFSLDGRLRDTRAEYAFDHGRRSGLRAMQQAADAIVHVAEHERDKQQRKHEGAAEPVPAGSYQI
jgi:hypothetical protein